MLAVGMTDITPDGGDGVDVALIQWMLSLTPAERLEQLEAFVDFVLEMRSGNAAEPDKGRYEPPKTPKSQRTVGVPDEILERAKSWVAMLPVNGPKDCVFPSTKLVTPIWPESVLRNYVRPKLRPAQLGWINFAVLRRSHSTLHKHRKSDLKIIADQQGHGMRTHLDSYVQSGVTERKAEAAKLYGDFTAVLHKRG
jgi:hypothetical protein